MTNISEYPIPNIGNEVQNVDEEKVKQVKDRIETIYGNDDSFEIKDSEPKLKEAAVDAVQSIIFESADIETPIAILEFLHAKTQELLAQEQPSIAAIQKVLEIADATDIGPIYLKQELIPQYLKITDMCNYLRDLEFRYTYPALANYLERIIRGNIGFGISPDERYSSEKLLKHMNDKLRSIGINLDDTSVLTLEPNIKPINSKAYPLQEQINKPAILKLATDYGIDSTDPLMIVNEIIASGNVSQNIVNTLVRIIETAPKSNRDDFRCRIYVPTPEKFNEIVNTLQQQAETYMYWLRFNTNIGWIVKEPNVLIKTNNPAQEYVENYRNIMDPANGDPLFARRSLMSVVHGAVHSFPDIDIKTIGIQVIPDCSRQLNALTHKRFRDENIEKRPSALMKYIQLSVMNHVRAELRQSWY